MKRNPRVSVIIATYNYSAVLRYAIQTVLWQTFTDWELIVVGDCCTDDSAEVVQSFGDARIRWLNLAENSGSKSLPQNAGLKIAQANLMAYLAHDDLWHPRHLETLVRAMEASPADLVYSVAVYVPPPGQNERHLSGVFPEGEFRAGSALVHSSVLHRRDLIDDLGDWPDPRTTQMPGDHFFWTRAAEAGKRFLAVPKLTVWKFNASSRPGSYLTKRSDEQARYFARLRDEPELAEKELIECAESAMRDGLQPLRTQKPGRDAPPGSFIHSLRQIRGLDPVEPTTPLPPEFTAESLGFVWPEPPPAVTEPRARWLMEVQISNSSEFALTSHAPHPIYFSYHWLDAAGAVVIFDGVRTPLIPPLEAGASRHYFVEIAAPAAAGMYRLQPALVQEGIRWIEPDSLDGSISIEVKSTTD